LYRQSDSRFLGQQIKPDPSRSALLNQVRRELRVRHLSRRTAKAYIGWILRFLRFHPNRDPGKLDESEISAFLTHLATHDNVSASTQNQARSALLFLYRRVLRRDIEDLKGVVRAKVSRRIPVVLTREEVTAVIDRLQGPQRLMVELMYGCGLRLLECLRLRVKDVDFGRFEIVVRSGKGNKDRRTVLPETIVETLREHLTRVKSLHERDLESGAGQVELPASVDRKYPNAGKSWGWQWIFPAARTYRDSLTGQRRRHHYHESALQRAVKEAVLRAGIHKPASCHTFRHYAEFRVMPSWATEVLESVVSSGDLWQADRFVSA
jgi:integron integrase